MRGFEAGITSLNTGIHTVGRIPCGQSDVRYLTGWERVGKSGSRKSLKLLPAPLFWVGFNAAGNRHISDGHSTVAVTADGPIHIVRE